MKTVDSKKTIMSASRIQLLVCYFTKKISLHCVTLILIFICMDILQKSFRIRDGFYGTPEESFIPDVLPSYSELQDRRLYWFHYTILQGQNEEFLKRALPFLYKLLSPFYNQCNVPFKTASFSGFSQNRTLSQSDFTKSQFIIDLSQISNIHIV